MLFDLYIPYFVLSFLIFLFLNLEAKSIDFVLSSPKWILSLLSTFNCFSISLISLCWQTRHFISTEKYFRTGFHFWSNFVLSINLGKNRIKAINMQLHWYKSTLCLVWCQYIFCRWKYVFYCHVNSQDHSVEMSYIFMGVSSSHRMSATWKIWWPWTYRPQTIVERKNALSKSWIL